jgi:hypothetical protein
MNQLTPAPEKYLVWFEIAAAADEEMLTAAEPLEEFLKGIPVSFCATGRGRPSGNLLKYQIAFNSQEDAERANKEWLTYRYLFP